MSNRPEHSRPEDLPMLFRAAVVLFLPVALAGAQTSDDSAPVFKGQVAEGSWLRVRTFNGHIQVREGTGRDVVVTGQRRYGRSSSEITFNVVRDGSNVTVCAIWERTRQCDADGYETRSGRDREDSGHADFVVELPRGIKLASSTGNGRIEITNAGGEVVAESGNGRVTVDGAGGSVDASSGNGNIEVNRAGGFVKASSGNGDIRVSTARGPVNAHTGNGRIEVDMASVPRDGDMDFTTGNGSITVDLPSDIAATIEANVSPNRFDTDFPIQLPAHWNDRRVEGTINGGGRRMEFSTGNGRVTIRKHG
jgi:hypothetical protein